MPFEYDNNSLFEDYYCFFLWLKRNNLKFKFLNAEGNNFKDDLETTSVFDFNNNLVLYHTWYARTYGVVQYHTERINNVIEKGKFIKEYSKRDLIWYKDYKIHGFNT